jgi:RNA polymerase sigma-70 factor (ECF subfamily)
MRTTPFASLEPLFAISDEQAMWRVQTQDDEQAFASLVRRWEEPIRRLCTRMTGDAHRGEDLAQDTFARFFTRRHDYQPGGRVSTWLWRIALNLCYDELRRRKRRSETGLDAAGDDGLSVLDTALAPEPAPDAAAAEQEQAELVRAAMLNLPESYRTVVVLRHYEHLKFQEIAEVLEIPEGTVKSRMAEALSRLSQRLRPVLERDRQARPHGPAPHTACPIL